MQLAYLFKTISYKLYNNLKKYIFCKLIHEYRICNAQDCTWVVQQQDWTFILVFRWVCVLLLRNHEFVNRLWILHKTNQVAYKVKQNKNVQQKGLLEILAYDPKWLNGK